MKSIIVILILVLAPMISINHQVPFVKGINEDPYKSGYQHGVNDANGTSGPLYLEEPGKGLAFHTEKFNQGYIDGFCSITGKDSSSDSDAGTFYCSESATQFNGTNKSPYQHGFVTGQNDSKTNTYDVTNACNDYNTINNTAAQVFECLRGYADGNISPYHSGYLQGIQGIQLKGTHTSEFMKGYSKGTDGYWSNRGLVEGYNGLSPSSKNVNYTQEYKDGHAEMVSGYSGTKKCGIDLGKLPTFTNDDYRQFYLGIDEGGDAYWIVDGAHYFLYDGPPGHTAEFIAGWKFGYGLGLGFDSDCGGVAEVTK